MKRPHIAAALALVTLAAASAERSAAAASGEPYRVHALVGARVVTAPGKVLARATIVVRDGVIEAIGPDVTAPADARVWDLAGRTVYPGLIDAYLAEGRLATTGEEKKDPPRPESEGPRETPKAPGASHTYPWVHPERDSADEMKLNPEALEKYRAMGFVAGRAVPDAGIFRGLAAVLSLGDGSVNRQMLRPRAATVVSLEGADGEYPSSLMGVIALVRQTFFDARWYRDAQGAWAHRPAGRERPEQNRALEALKTAVDGEMTVVVDGLRDPLNVMRAARIAQEHGLRIEVVASGAEYRRIPEVKGTGTPLVLPLDFPDPPPVGDDEDEWSLIATDTLRHWKRAPSNPRWLDEAGVDLALTTARLKDPGVFLDRLRAAVASGYDKTHALAALTTVPARRLGVSHLLGTVEKGKIASFLVADGDLFADNTRIQEVWIDGARYESKKKAPEAKPADATGAWLVRLTEVGAAPPAPIDVALEIAASEAGLKGWMVVLAPPSGRLRIELACAELEGKRLIAGFDGVKLGYPGMALLTADLDDDTLTGFIDTAFGVVVAVRGDRASAAKPVRKKGPAPPRERPRPEGSVLAAPPALVVRGATVWTEATQGTLENADMIVTGGKVSAVGRGLAVPPGGIEIDGRGMHLTPGLIDAHSHTAISGDVNEGTAAVTAEVRIGDVVDSEDWNIYSELAGGLTAANQLHGSANPIGGQSQTIKLRWGAPPEDLKLEGAKPGIKFALGENVKQSNWGEKYVVRYPQTRMGVEQVMRERFLAARDYQRKWDEWRQKRLSDADAIPPRKDIQLDTIAEILRGERLIHCHSYVGPEILMLIRLAEEFGVTIGTFQHVLEGYKVADEMGRMGAGASTFSDWWAYKFEVYDAMPWNGALMWDRGVVVSFNSDSNEQARRLNTEAAKAIKYGGLSEADALKFVTLNPAMQLRIDDRVGSLEPGKDGDFVLWNGNPLSSTSRVEQTWIEGKKYFDRAQDLARRAEVERERKALIAEAKEAGAGKPPEGGGGRPGKPAAGAQLGELGEEVAR